VLAAGLRDLSRLSRARADEIAATSGLPLPLAEQISQRFARYHAESGTATVAPEKHERARLSALVSELERNERAYREASDAWSDEAMAGKRRLRRERDTILCEVQVALARLGELESLQELEPMPIDRKLASLKRILQSHA
ncbi:MAG: hypothetical protein K8H88_31805, partial [Sandaracinaceae bacterium]|nr:hypothetical protein [Sandaracinaceae bacterium]